MRPFDDRCVQVDGEEQIGLVLIGDGRPLIKRDHAVISACEDDSRSQPRLEIVCEFAAERKRRILFHHSARPDRADFFAAVSRIDHDRVNPRRLDRPRGNDDRRQRRRSRSDFVKVEHDPKWILEFVGIGAGIRRFQIEAQIARRKRRFGDVRIVVRLRRKGRANLGFRIVYALCSFVIM